MAALVARDQLRLDIEEMQQVDQLLQRVEYLGRVARRVAPAPQGVEACVEARVLAAQRADFERLGGDGRMVRAIPLETLEGRRPRIDASRCQQRLGQRLVRRDVRGRPGERLRERGDRGIDVSLLVEHHAEVELGVGQVGPQGERALVGARGAGEIVPHLERDALVVVRLGVVGLARDRLAKRRRCDRGIALHEAGAAERAPQRRGARRQREPFTRERARAGSVAAVDEEIGERGARAVEFRRRGDRCTQSVQRVVDRAAVALENRTQIPRRRVAALPLEHPVVLGTREIRVAGLVPAHGRVPMRGKLAGARARCSFGCRFAAQRRERLEYRGVGITEIAVSPKNGVRAYFRA